jgi:hypothetical protein
MKRKVIAAVIGTAGLVGMAASSYGQGNIQFNTYQSTGYYPIVYGAGTGGLQNTGAGVNVDGELAYFIGTATGSSVFTMLPSSIIAVSSTAKTPGVYANDPSGSGYIVGSAIAIPGYVSGPISFEIFAWAASGTGSGVGGTLATSTINDSSAPLEWTEASIASGLSPAGFFQALPGEVVLTATATPEPTTLALAGLAGLVSLVAYRRKQV